MGGGAIGAAARYLIGISPLNSLFGRFPFPTLLINVIGSFLIGLLAALLADRFAASETLRLFVIVGILGGFTTFSAFEAEMYGLARGGEYITAFLYLFLSVFLGFVSVVIGVELGRRLQ